MITPEKHLKISLQLISCAGLLAVFATGCATYQQQNKVITYWRAGDLNNATNAAIKMADANADDKDTVIWRLEEGTVLRADGKYDDSNKAFGMAEQKVDDYEQQAKVHVGKEAGALLSNQAELPYEGRAYDDIMMDTYEFLNDLALGEVDQARPMIIRAYQRQQDAVEENKKRIQATQDEANKQGNSAAIKKAQQDPKFQSAMQADYASLNNLNAYADYVNPFTVYLDGLYFMYDAADSSDLEHARKSLQRVAGYDPDNQYVKEDLATLDGLANGKPLQPTTYVIFETGCAPIRGQIKIQIPVITPTQVTYVGAAFPTLILQGNYLPNLTVTAANPVVAANDPPPGATGVTNNMAPGQTPAIAGASPEATATATTSVIANMDDVIGLDFKNEMPVVITKTIASTVVKAIASYAANQAANQANSYLGAFMQISTFIYQAAVNIADTRTWTTLPKEFQACRLPTPPDRKIVLETPGGFQKIPVTIEDGTINIVYVKSITATSPLLVSQMKLK